MERLANIQAIAAAAAAAGSIQKQVEAFVAKLRMLLDDGLTIAEVGLIFGAFIRMLVLAAEDVVGATGFEKKQLVLQYVSYLFDMLAPSFPLPWFLAPFRKYLQEPIRAVVMAIAEGFLEVIVSWMKEPDEPAPSTTS